MSDGDVELRRISPCQEGLIVFSMICGIDISGEECIKMLLLLLKFISILAFSFPPARVSCFLLSRMLFIISTSASLIFFASMGSSSPSPRTVSHLRY